VLVSLCYALICRLSSLWCCAFGRRSSRNSKSWSCGTNSRSSGAPHADRRSPPSTARCSPSPADSCRAYVGGPSSSHRRRCCADIGGKPGHSRGATYGSPRQFPTLPTGLRHAEMDRGKLRRSSHFRSSLLSDVQVNKKCSMVGCGVDWLRHLGEMREEIAVLPAPDALAEHACAID
jgi:hypothetical protein